MQQLSDAHRSMYLNVDGTKHCMRFFFNFPVLKVFKEKGTMTYTEYIYTSLERIRILLFNSINHVLLYGYKIDSVL